MLQAVFLDKGSLDNNDLDFSKLTSLPVSWTCYHNTEPAALMARIRYADIIVTNKVVMTEQAMAQTGCKLICVAATGINNIAINAAGQYGISVCNIRGYATPAVVQHTFMLMMALSNNLLAYRQSLQDMAWQKSEFFSLFTHPITELQGKTLGVIGYGELGKAVAIMAKAFGMKVLIAESFINKNDSSRTNLKDIFIESDVISLHCALTKDTRNIINGSHLALMKPSAILINTARGELVDEVALKQALLNKTIAAAGIDVLQKEPPCDSNELLQLNIPNLIITPHIAWATQASRQRLLDELVLNIEAFLAGKSRNNVI